MLSQLWYITCSIPQFCSLHCLSLSLTHTSPPTHPTQVWDVNMDSRPVEVYTVHDYLRSRLCSLYENDSIFDRFECGWNGDDSYPYMSNIVCTGVCVHEWFVCACYPI